MNFTQSPERELLLAAMASGAATGRFTTSRLMSPAELSAVARHRRDLRGLVEGWCLCVEVPGGMWQRALKAIQAGVPNHLTIVEMGSGRSYMAVVMQTGKWQHRLCIPLVGTLTAEWLDTLILGYPLQMSVASPTSEQAFLSFTDVPPGAIAALRNADTSLPADRQVLIEEVMKFVAWNSTVAKLDRVEEMPEPNEVSLSLLIPGELQAELERGAGAAWGSKPS